MGTLQVDTLKPSRLLIPTAKSLTGPIAAPTPGIDHFRCDTIKISPRTPKFPKGLQTTVTDQFNQPKVYDLLKPTRLCSPVNKNHESPGAETHPTHLLCYQVKPAKGEAKHTKVDTIYVNNQLGPELVDTLKDGELCVPSIKIEPEGN